MGDRSITLRERDDEAPDPRMAADGCAGAATAAPSEDEPARAVAAARGRRAPTRAGAAGATPMMGTSRARKMDLTGTTVRRGKHVANYVGVGRAAPITGGAVIPKWSMTRLPRRPCPTPNPSCSNASPHSRPSNTDSIAPKMHGNNKATVGVRSSDRTRASWYNCANLILNQRKP